MKLQDSLMLTVFKCTLAGICVGLATALLLMCIVLLLSSTLYAAELKEQVTDVKPNYEIPGDAKCGTLLFYSDKGLASAPVLKMKVHMKISGMIVRVKVNQVFNNPEDLWKEGIYVFPLPENAAVDHMRVHIGERIIEGQIKEYQEAKKYIHKQRTVAGKPAL